MNTNQTLFELPLYLSGKANLLSMSLIPGFEERVRIKCSFDEQLRIRLKYLLYNIWKK